MVQSVSVTVPSLTRRRRAVAEPPVMVRPEIEARDTSVDH